ncbi:SDR family NAD(P)-dependent oxidoreductase [Myxococcota bacterium]|nr:SDR family NAD(P)-dependent oxidoreductase [Myxococcota bacterium]
MKNLNQKVAVVTGAASGIGLALAQAFCGEGMKVVLADVERDPLASAAEALQRTGADIEAVPTDVTDPEQVEALANAARKRFGAVHLVCNNAGVAPIGSILETRLEDWRWLLDVNVLGVVHGIAAFGPKMVEQGEGHIVNTASAGGLITVPGFGAYAATKHAVVALSETLYQEVHGTGVGVSVLCPGLVRTRIFESERNRPTDGGPLNYGQPQEQAQQSLTSLGAAPLEIARHVVDAVREDRLHILPSPEVIPVLEDRFRRILAGDNLQVVDLSPTPES